MTATDELRRLLDERGVEWERGLPTETIVREPIDALYVERPDGRMHVYFRSYLAPEQAVAATLGASGTCIADETETWECICDQIGRYGKRVTVHVMECSECGHTYEHVNGDYEYCPHCGRRVVEVDA